MYVCMSTLCMWPEVILVLPNIMFESLSLYSKGADIAFILHCGMSIWRSSGFQPGCYWMVFKEGSPAQYAVLYSMFWNASLQNQMGKNSFQTALQLNITFIWILRMCTQMGRNVFMGRSVPQGGKRIQRVGVCAPLIILNCSREGCIARLGAPVWVMCLDYNYYNRLHILYVELYRT